jgi:hypothetical protein
MSTITVPRAVLEQALEALEATHYDIGPAERQRLDAVDAITALRAALAQQEQEQEPVAWMLPGSNAIIMAATKVYRGALAKYYTQPLYTTPPRREWRGLTMQEINALPEVGGRMWNMGSAVAVLRAIRAVEQALKEKNNG